MTTMAGAWGPRLQVGSPWRAAASRGGWSRRTPWRVAVGCRVGLRATLGLDKVGGGGGDGGGEASASWWSLTGKRGKGKGKQDPDGWVRDAHEALRAWAEADGMFVSDAVETGVPVGDPHGGGMSTRRRPHEDVRRGVVATRDVRRGEVLIEVPAARCSALTASAARDDPLVGTLVASYEARVAAGGEAAVSEEAVLGLWICLGRGLGAAGCPALGAYACALPYEMPALASFWDDEDLWKNLAPEVATRALDLREVMWVDVQDIIGCWEEASRGGAAAGEVGEAVRALGELPEEEAMWAWTMVQSRALRLLVRSGEDGVERWTKHLVPVVDCMNHAPSPVPASAWEGAPEGGRRGEGRWELRGASAVTEASDRGAAAAAGTPQGPEPVLRWRAARDMAAGEEITWGYGPLSNEDLLIGYGFVPCPHLHGDCVATFLFPDTMVAGELDAMCEGMAEEVWEAKRHLLQVLGALPGPEESARGGSSRGGGDGNSDEEAWMLELHAGLASPPGMLLGMAGILVAGSSELGLYDKYLSGAYAPLDQAGPEAQENARRARGYASWLLEKVQAELVGGGSAEGEGRRDSELLESKFLKGGRAAGAPRILAAALRDSDRRVLESARRAVASAPVPRDLKALNAEHQRGRAR